MMRPYSNYNNIPEDIKIDVLSRVDSKSLWKLESVSKEWLSLIRSKEFVERHRKCQMHNEKPMFIAKGTELFFTIIRVDEISAMSIDLKFPTEHEFYYIDVVGSCNGMVMVITEDMVYDKRMFVGNIVRKQFVSIMNSPFRTFVSGVFLLHGFGYDEGEEDHKIVTLSNYDPYNSSTVTKPTVTFVYVYSLRSQMWRQVVNFPYQHNIHKDDRGVFAHGSVHWLFKNGSNDCSYIVAFNLRNETFREFSVTSEADHLLVHGGNIHMVVKKDGWGIEVWSMTLYGMVDSWSKLFSVRNGTAFQSIKPILELANENSVIVELDGQKLVVYNFKDQSTTDLVVHGVEDTHLEYIGKYFESLVSPT